jgi:DNA-binding SARP family transcriptional activator
MDLRVLGNVRVEADNGTITLDRAAERGVLATFALNPGRPVDISTLIDHVWGERPPPRAEMTIAGYVRVVRRAIDRAGGQRDWLVNRRPRAYELRIDRSMVDYYRFGALVAEAAANANSGDHSEAVAGYQRAVELWTGDPLGDVTGDWAERYRVGLRQEHLDAVCALLELQLRTGAHAAVVSRATQLINEFVPTDRLIELALYGLAYGGHQALIPGFLDRAGRRMSDAVHVGPSREVQSLAHRLVTEPNGVGRLAPTATSLDPVAPVNSGPPVSSDSSDAAEEAGTAVSDQLVMPISPDGGKHPSVVMTATLNKNVYQAAGDQYIVES